MIGSGIFLVSAESGRLVGTPGRLLAVWATAGALTILAALSCAELAVMFPEAGGPTVFLTRAFGPLAGFLYGWSLVTVVQTGTIAAVCVAFARYLGVLSPAVHGLTEKVVALALLAILTAANARGLRTGTRIQNLFTAVKLAAFAALVAGCLAASPIAPAAAPARAVPEGTALALAFATALVGPLFSQSAWTNVTFPGAEVSSPARTFPIALIGGCGLVASLYVAANAGYLRVLSFGGVTGAPADRVGSAAAEALLPGLGGMLMAAAILVSTAGCANGLVLSGSRLLFAVARDVRPLGAAAHLNGNGVPGVALVLQGLWAGVLVLSGTYGQLLKYVVSAELLLLIALVLAVPVLRRRAPELPRGHRTFGYPITPWLFAVPALAVSALLLIASPATNLLGLGLVLAGVPVHALTRPR